MYNKFAKGDLIKITNPTITYPVSANIEMWDNNELRTFENLNRPMRNLFENNQELHSIIKNLQSGLKMGGSSILNGCELVVSESFDEKRYVSLTPGLFFYDDVSYSIYPTPSIASRQLERDLGIDTTDGIDHITITYENGKFKASINITKSLNPLPEATTNEFDRGIDLLNDIEAKIIASDSSLAPKFDSLENYALEPCFVIPTTETRYVNFNPSSKEIVLEETSSSLNFGFVDNFIATNNTKSRWVGLVEDSYKDNSVTNAKLDDMEENTLKGNNAVPGDPKDLGKEDVVAMFNLVTMDSPQTIDGTKTFIADQEIKNNKKLTFAPNWSISSNDSNAFVIDESGTSIISIAGNSGAMTIVNPVSLSGTLDVAGATTLANSLTVNASDDDDKKIDFNGPTTITGATTIIGNFTVGDTDDDGSTTIKNPVELSNTLAVSGVSTLNNSLIVDASDDDDKKIDLKGPTTITGITIVKGGNLTIGELYDSNITKVNNPVELKKTLSVTGITTLNNSLTVDASDDDKKIDFNGPTTITGATTIIGDFTVGDTDDGNITKVNNPVELSDTLTVNASDDDKKIDFNGPTTITGATKVIGNFTVGDTNDGNITKVNNPVELSDTLTVSGVSTLNNSLTVNASDDDDKKIDFNGPTTITGATTIIGDFTVGGTDDGSMTVNNPVTLSNTLAVSGVATLNNSLIVDTGSGNVSIKAPTTIIGTTKVIGNFTVGELSDINITTINNPVVLNDKLTVEKETTINSSLTVAPTGVGKVSLNGPTETKDFNVVGNLTVDSSGDSKSIKLNGPTNIDGSFVVFSNGDDEEISMTGNTTIISKTGENDFINLSTPNLSTTSKTILLNSTDNTEEDAENRGVVVRGTSDKSFLWNSNNWVSSENINLNTGKTYKIDDTYVLSSTTLGAGVINSSLKTVGTITSGTWNGTEVAVLNGGTGQTSYTNGQLLIGDTTDNTLTKGTISGTPNRITVTNGNGTITLNTPQDIHTEASPTFVGLTLTGDLAVNGSAITTTKTTLDVLNTKLTGILNFANVATTINMGEVADINIGKATDSTKKVSILNKTISTTSASGALVVSGGVGIGGAVNIGGNLTTEGKITSVGLQSTATDADTSLEVVTNGVNTTGNVKSIISSTKKFSIEKGGTDGNLLSVEHDSITANVDVSATENITSTKTITGKNFVSTGRRTGGILYEVSDINSLKFNDYTIENTKNGNLTETDRANANLSLLWVDGAEQGEQIKKTPFSNFPVAYLNSDGTTGKNGLMSKDNLIRIKNLESAAGFTETGTPVGNFLYTVNDKGSIEGTNGTVIYSNDIKLKDASDFHVDGTNESAETIYGMFRTLRDEKVRVKGHLPAEAVDTAIVNQIIKKTKNTTDVVWGQITDDEIATTLTKVRPSSKKGDKANTTGTIHKVAFWNNNEESLLSHNDITYDTSSKTLIAETVSSRSSRKLKKDIELYEKSAFDTIDKIDIVSYHFIADETQTDRVGFIAEDSPELVSGKDRDHMEMNNCIGLLLKAVQELKEENQELRKLINDRNS